MKILTSVVSNIPLGCKLIYLVSFLLYIIGFIFSKVPLAIANYPELVFKNKQIYRLFITFLSKGPSVLSIIAIFSDFILIRFFFTKLEHNHSTVFFIIEILIQNLTFQVFFTIFSAIFIYTNFLTSFLVSYGWTPLIVIFVYKYAFKDTKDKIKLFCIQFEKKYLPYVIGILAIVFAFDQFVCIALSVVFGTLQFGLYGKHFVSLPLGFYKAIQSCIPQCIKSSPNFIKIDDCQSNILQQCWKPSIKKQPSQNIPKEQVAVAQKITNITDPQKKVKKARKTSGRNKNNKSASGSQQFTDQIDTGRSGKDIQEELPSESPNINIETNNELHREDKM